MGWVGEVEEDGTGVDGWAAEEVFEECKARRAFGICVSSRTSVFEVEGPHYDKISLKVVFEVLLFG